MLKHSSPIQSTSGRFKVFCVTECEKLSMACISWIDPIKSYLRNDTLLDDVDEAIKIKDKLLAISSMVMIYIE